MTDRELIREEGMMGKSVMKTIEKREKENSSTKTSVQLSLKAYPDRYGYFGISKITSITEL